MKRVSVGVFVALIGSMLVSNGNVHAEIKATPLQSTLSSSADRFSTTLLSSKHRELKFNEKFISELKKGRVYGLSINKYDTVATLTKKFGGVKSSIGIGGVVNKTFAKLPDVVFSIDDSNNTLYGVYVLPRYLPTTSLTKVKKLLGVPNDEFEDGYEGETYYTTRYELGTYRLEFQCEKLGAPINLMFIKF